LLLFLFIALVVLSAYATCKICPTTLGGFWPGKKTVAVAFT